jgi:DNA adenine methylase
MSYPGGKSASGVYQKLINMIPPHDVYIETHLGGGAIMLNKLIARTNIGIDVDPIVIREWKSKNLPIRLYPKDAVNFLREYSFIGNEFVYADPPYLAETRKGRSLYRYDYSVAQHEELLLALKSLPCAVMVSGYWSRLYSESLRDWRTASFPLRTRSGEIATEWVWMNYETPIELHDYRFLGMDFRERERIKRRQERWVSRLRQMSQMERQALLAAIQSESARGWL